MQDQSGRTRRDVIGLLGAGAALAPGLASGAEARGAARLPGVPPRAIIRTLLRDVEPSELADKAILFHEHIGNKAWQRPTPGYAYNETRPANYKEDINYQSEEMRLAAEDGIGLIVDGGHEDMGRDLASLRAIQRRSGLMVVGSGGYYLKTTYPPEIATLSEDGIAEHLVLEANANLYGAFGEIGTSTAIDPLERKVIRAVGKAHRATNLPIFGHTDIRPEARNTALEQLDIYESVGVDPRRVAIGHIQGFDDPALHAAVAKRGAFVGWDRVGNIRDAADDQRSVRQILKFIEAGYADHVLLASDFAQEPETRQKGGPGIGKTLTVFVPKLRAAGVPEAVLNRIVYDNPRRFLAFVPKFTPKG